MMSNLCTKDKIAIQQIVDRLKDMTWDLETDPQEVARIFKILRCIREEPSFSKFVKAIIATEYSDPEYDGPYVEIGKNKEQDND